jgi:hypothetical protein
MAVCGADTDGCCSVTVCVCCRVVLGWPFIGFVVFVARRCMHSGVSVDGRSTDVSSMFCTRVSDGQASRSRGVFVPSDMLQGTGGEGCVVERQHFVWRPHVVGSCGSLQDDMVVVILMACPHRWPQCIHVCACVCMYPCSWSIDCMAYLQCAHCKSQLTLLNFAQANGITFCKPHFKELFMSTSSVVVLQCVVS